MTSPDGSIVKTSSSTGGPPRIRSTSWNATAIKSARSFRQRWSATTPALPRLSLSPEDCWTGTTFGPTGQVDPGNAKMRGLTNDVLDRGAWRLAWLPPSLPYYEPAGAYAEPQLQSFTKRLVFSAWAVVPKAIAVMLSYEAERRAVEAASGIRDRAYDDRPLTPPLQFRMTGDRAAGMPALALLYPSVALARAGDPLKIARTLGAELPITRDSLLAFVRDRCETFSAGCPTGSVGIGTPDQRWYWAAPFLLDRGLADGDNEHFLRGCARGTRPTGRTRNPALERTFERPTDVAGTRARSAA